MERRKRNDTHFTVRLPIELVASVDAYINDGDNPLGYRSRAEFVADATRRLLADVAARTKK